MRLLQKAWTGAAMVALTPSKLSIYILTVHVCTYMHRAARPAVLSCDLQLTRIRGNCVRSGARKLPLVPSRRRDRLCVGCPAACPVVCYVFYPPASSSALQSPRLEPTACTVSVSVGMGPDRTGCEDVHDTCIIQRTQSSVT